MNQESTCSGHQNKAFCFEQRVVQIDQAYLGQQCPWCVHLGVLGFLHSGGNSSVLLCLQVICSGVGKQAKCVSGIHPLSRLWLQQVVKDPHLNGYGREPDLKSY